MLACLVEIYYDIGFISEVINFRPRVITGLDDFKNKLSLHRFSSNHIAVSIVWGAKIYVVPVLDYSKNGHYDLTKAHQNSSMGTLLMVSNIINPRVIWRNLRKGSWHLKAFKWWMYFKSFWDTKLLVYQKVIKLRLLKGQ